jgi:acyl carrier protein
MNHAEKLQAIVRAAVGDPHLVIDRSTTATEVEGWDSLAHISIMFAVEEDFGVEFDAVERESFRNIGELLDRLEGCRSRSR